MSGLPPELRELVDRLVAGSGLEGAEARRARRDLELHLLDGLDAGRSPEELAALFGDPERVAPLLRGTPPPVERGPAHPRGDGVLAATLHDLRQVVRTLVKAPTFALTAVAVLALGIAATAVVATVVNEVVLRPLPVEDQRSLVDIWAEIPGGNSFVGFAWGDFADFRERDAVLEDLAAFMGLRMRLGEQPGGGEQVVGQLVSANWFDLLGVAASLGRLELPAAPPFGSEPRVVLSHDFWRSSFGADPGVVGRTVRLDGHLATVVGVGPEGFAGTFIGFPVDLWLPLAAADPFLTDFQAEDRARKPFELVGRLRPGATPEQVDASLDRIAAELEVAHPEANDGLRVGVARTTGVDHSLRGAVAAFVAVLSGVALLVLLIACLNVGSLLLVRTMSREREVAVRLALGAGKGRLTRQLLVEAGALVAAAAMLGVLLARELNGQLRDLVAAIAGGLHFELALDWRVVGLTVAAAGLAVVGAALAPALHLVGRQPASALRARVAESRSGGRLRAVLVVGQVAVSVVLVVVSGLFARSVMAGASADPGFPVDGLASLTVTLDPERYPTEERPAMLERLVREMAALPGVESAALSLGPPLDVARSPTRIHIPGVEPPPDRDSLVVDARRVGGGYLETMGIPLLLGEGLPGARGGMPVAEAVVSRAFAEAYWPGQDPVGRVVGASGRELRVVGMAEDARYMVQDRSPDPLLYLPLDAAMGASARIVIRADDPAAVAGAVDGLVRGLVPGHPPALPGTVRETLRQALFPQRVGVAVVGSMGLAALLLAALGLYGLVQFSVTRDRRQLGVRLALGGGPRSVLATVLRRGFLLAGVGIVAGLAAALVLTRSLEGLLVEVGPADPATYGAVAGCFTLVALLASWLPARRAMRIEPAEVLRGE